MKSFTAAEARKLTQESASTAIIMAAIYLKIQEACRKNVTEVTVDTNGSYTLDTIIARLRQEGYAVRNNPGEFTFTVSWNA